jgi:teichuronic acid biosynthesis glycosyltransferase TuaC
MTVHVLVIPSWFPTNADPIRGSFFVEQAEMLSRHGHRVGILIPPSIVRTRHGLDEIRAHWRRSPTDFMVRAHGEVASLQVPWWGARGLVSYAARLRVTEAAFTRYVAEHGVPDVLHAHSVLHGGVVATRLGQRRGIPTVITEHSSNLVKPLRRIHFGHRRLVHRTLADATEVIAVSKGLAQALRRFTDRPVHVIPNAVSLDAFFPSEPLLPEPFTYLTIGSLIPVKGHDLLLESFSRLPGKDARLVIVGDGPLRTDLEVLAARLGVASRCVFAGRVARAAMADTINAAHVVVSASVSETFGVTLIEALACGRPIVATRSGGPLDIVTPDVGLLTDADPESLCEAMQRVRETFDGYDRDAIRRRCADSFGEASVVRRLEDVFDSAVSGRSSPRE